MDVPPYVDLRELDRARQHAVARPPWSACAMQVMGRCLVSLGCNVGDSDAALTDAERALRSICEPNTLALSERFVTAPIGGPAGQRPFTNAAATFSFLGSPRSLLRELQAIESRHERRRAERWGPRTLDLDLLMHEEFVVDEPGLRLPHPRMTFRRFVLDPACELAAEWRHPECERRIGELRRLLDEGDNMVHLSGDDGSVEEWIKQNHPGVTTTGVAPQTDAQYRLAIECSSQRTRLGPSGPRLVLADCPREHWEAEVAAAIESVWPAPR